MDDFSTIAPLSGMCESAVYETVMENQKEVLSKEDIPLPLAKSSFQKITQLFKVPMHGFLPLLFYSLLIEFHLIVPTFG